MTQITNNSVSYLKALPFDIHAKEILPRVFPKGFFTMSATCKTLHHNNWSVETLMATLKYLWPRYYPLSLQPSTSDLTEYQNFWKKAYFTNDHATKGRFTSHNMLVTTPHPHGPFITCICWTKHQECMCGFSDGSIKYLKTTDNDVNYSISHQRELRHQNGLKCAKVDASVYTLTKSDDLIVAALFNGSICVWYGGIQDAPPKIFDLRVYPFIGCLAISSDGQKIIIGYSHWIRIIDKDLSIDTEEEFQLSNVSYINAIVPHDNRLVCGYHDGSIDIQDYNKKQCLYTLKASDGIEIRALSVDEHQNLIVTLTDASIEVWNLADKHCIAHYPGARGIHLSSSATSRFDTKGSCLLFNLHGQDIQCLNFASDEQDILKSIANSLMDHSNPPGAASVERFLRLPKDTKDAILCKLSDILKLPPDKIILNSYKTELAYAISWYFTLPKFNPSDCITPIVENIQYWGKEGNPSISNDLVIQYNELPEETRSVFPC